MRDLKGSSVESESPLGGGETGVEAIRDARRELDEVIREIQAVPRFKTFLAPPTFDDVATAATDQPIVCVTSADTGGLALIVEGADVRHVPLGAITRDGLRQRVARYLNASWTYRADPSKNMATGDSELDAMLRWLWDAAMEPISRFDGSGRACCAGSWWPTWTGSPARRVDGRREHAVQASICDRPFDHPLRP
jgi:hypothetical protein